MLPEIIVHKMVYDKGYYGFDSSILQKYKFIDLSDDYTSEYIKIYNKCFYDMRRQLKVEPYDFYSSKVQLADKYSNIKLLILENNIVGSVGIYDNEIDDLIVAPAFQGNGYAKILLNYAINNMDQGSDIILHVVATNNKAVDLYLGNGFIITETFKAR